MVRKILLLVCLCIMAVVLCSLAGCGSLQSTSRYIDFNKVTVPPVVPDGSADSQALKVAVSSVLLPQETTVHYRAIAEFLGREIDRPIVLIQRQSLAEIALLLINGGADIAFFSSGEYANYSGFPEIEMLASQQRLGVPYYQGYVLVTKDSDIHDIADLKGKTIAFTDPLSYSGYTFVVQLLGQSGQAPETFFGRYIYTYNHDKSFRAVANRVVDAASVTNIVYNRAKERQPGLAEAVRIIAVSPPAGIGPVVAGKSVDRAQRDELRKALLAMHENPKMSPALKGLSIDRFIPPQPELFEPIHHMLRNGK